MQLCILVQAKYNDARLHITVHSVQLVLFLCSISHKNYKQSLYGKFSGASEKFAKKRFLVPARPLGVRRTKK